MDFSAKLIGWGAKILHYKVNLCYRFQVTTSRCLCLRASFVLEDFGDCFAILVSGGDFVGNLLGGEFDVVHESLLGLVTADPHTSRALGVGIKLTAWLLQK